MDWRAFAEILEPFPQHFREGVRHGLRPGIGATVYDGYNASTRYATHEMSSHHSAFRLLKQINQAFQNQFPPPLLLVRERLNLNKPRRFSSLAFSLAPWPTSRTVARGPEYNEAATFYIDRGRLDRCPTAPRSSHPPTLPSSGRSARAASGSRSGRASAGPGRRSPRSSPRSTRP